jgi:hypothetical protein
MIRWPKNRIFIKKEHVYYVRNDYNFFISVSKFNKIRHQQDVWLKCELKEKNDTRFIKEVY